MEWTFLPLFPDTFYKCQSNLVKSFSLIINYFKQFFIKQNFGLIQWFMFTSLGNLRVFTRSVSTSTNAKPTSRDPFLKVSTLNIPSLLICNLVLYEKSMIKIHNMSRILGQCDCISWIRNHVRNRLRQNKT